MKTNPTKIYTGSITFILLFLALSCQEQEAIKPDSTPAGEINVLEQIKDLGFIDTDIHDLNSHYLVDGDILFSKEETEESFDTKERKIFAGKPVFTIGMDKFFADNHDWKKALELSIAEWNADENHHFNFEITTSGKTDIIVQQDNGLLPNDVPVASAFAMNGKMGSVIQINSDQDLENTTAFQQKMKKALSHCVGMRNTVTAKQGRQDSSSENARTAASTTPYLYAITDDLLYRINKSDGAWYVLSSGWSGTSHMTMSQTDGYLYMIHFGTLYKTNPSNGSWTPLTTGWDGTKSMVRNLHGVYALQNSDLVKVNSDGSKTLVGPGGAWAVAKIMTGVTQGLSIVKTNGLYFVSTVSGSADYGKSVKITGTGKLDPFWSGVTCISGTFRQRVFYPPYGQPLVECFLFTTTNRSGMYQRNHIYPWLVIEPADASAPVENTRKMTAMVGTKRKVSDWPLLFEHITYIIHDGTLVAFTPYEVLGVKGDWANTYLLASSME